MGKKYMKIILLSKVISITYIPRSRNFSSIKAENFSSLDRLAYYIGVAYKKLPFFQELTALKVIDILKSIMEGTYTLSPLHLHAYPKNGDQKHSEYFQKLLVKDEPNVYYVVNPTLEDRLVLMGLGFMLIHHFNVDNLFMDNIFSLRSCTFEFFDKVCARGKVLWLYKFDLSNSMKTINRASLLCKLSHIVKDEVIMELVGKYLYLPITLGERNLTTDKLGLGCIPPSGLLTKVLLNLAFTEFDKEFQRRFPGVYYSRYVHEVFVSFPKPSSGKIKPFPHKDYFEQLVFSLFDQLHLDGKIVSIRPGDAPVPCYCGLVCVSQDGEIQVKFNKE